jgi:hypothetical protein
MVFNDMMFILSSVNTCQRVSKIMDIFVCLFN